MKIGIDATFFSRDRRGMGRVARTIFDRFLRFYPHDFYLIMVKYKTDQKKIKDLFPGKELQFISPKDPCINGLDVVLFPWNRIDFHPSCRRVVVIHDMVPYRFFKPRKSSEGYEDRKRIKMACEAADRIITPSEFSKQEICTFLEIPHDKIHVIHHGVDESFCTCDIDRAKEATFLDRFSKGLPFILFVGNVEKRKNVEILLTAFGEAKKKYTFPHKLIVAGKCPGSLVSSNGGTGLSHLLSKVGLGKKAKKHRLAYMVEKLSIGDEVIWLGEVGDEDLLWLYRLAQLFVFPSEYEGFGMPILEAMASGVPSIVSNISSATEVAGDAALYFDVKDPRELAEKIWLVLSDMDLAARLQRTGLERAHQFQWDTSVRKFMEILEGVR